jgi:hypothetical protein
VSLLPGKGVVGVVSKNDPQLPPWERRRRGRVWEGRKQWLCGGLRAGAEREAWTRLGGEIDGRSK